MSCRTSRATRRPSPVSRAAISKAAISSAPRRRCSWCAPTARADEAIRAVEAELKLRSRRRDSRRIAPLAAKLEADPNDHQARFDLALALDGKGDREGAIDELLEIVRRDRKWNEEAARKHLVTLFEAMGPTDPRTIAARRRLSSHSCSPEAMARRRRYHNVADLPAVIPVFPLTGVLLLPRGQLPLNVFEPRYLAMVDAALDQAPPDRHDPAAKPRGRTWFAKPAPVRGRAARAHHRILARPTTGAI